MTATVKTLNEARQELLIPSKRPLIEQYPFTWYRVMREQAPVYYDAELKSWLVFRYDDVQQVLGDPTTFSSNIFDRPENDKMPLIESDPPRHRKLRSLVNQAFTSRQIASLTPAIRGIAHSLLDQVALQGKMDIVEDIAFPLPVIIISNMLGMSQENSPFLRTTIDAAVPEAIGLGEEERDLPTFPPEMQQPFIELIAQRRQTPGNDLLSALLAAQVDGEHLSDSEIIDLCILLYIAGHRTTTNVLANTFVCLLENPQVLQQVQSDFSLLPALVEEVMRYYSPVQAFTRRATRDVTLRDQHLHAGDSVTVCFGSANHDEQVFPEPERFDITRTPNKHMAFGHGIHFCLGAPLARLEVPIALQAILGRLQNIQRVSDDPLKKLMIWQFYGVEHLPITFTARSMNK